MPPRILLALDTPDVAIATAQTRAVGDAIDGIKLGLEFFIANGPAGVASVQREGRPLFLDLKLHDIPNTVAGAVRSALSLKPLLLTVHAGGGPEMLRAAADATAPSVRPMRFPSCAAIAGRISSWWCRACGPHRARWPTRNGS